jgi:hypothetical protein
MKKISFIFIFLFLFSGFSIAEVSGSMEWGSVGHRTVGEIAEQYLSKRAKKEIEKLLNGQSLAMVSTYGDDIKSDDEFNKYRPWHYVNFPFDSSYEEHPKNENGDIILGIRTCKQVLIDDNSSREEKVFHLKMLVHFMGDLHQPLHIGLAEDRGGNRFQVSWFNDGTNLHRVWDTHMIESYNMSFSELANNTKKLSKWQIKEIQKGSTIDWMYESRKLCVEIYDNTEVGEKLGYRYMYDYMESLRNQLQKGGLRLAAILNDIFG